MNGSGDEQHDARVNCYRIAVAVAYGDAVVAAYVCTTERQIAANNAQGTTFNGHNPA
jgi:hypothetical protein